MEHGEGFDRDLSKLAEANNKATSQKRQLELAEDKSEVVRYVLAGATENIEVQKKLAADKSKFVLSALAWNTKEGSVQELLRRRPIQGIRQVLERRKEISKHVG